MVLCILSNKKECSVIYQTISNLKTSISSNEKARQKSFYIWHFISRFYTHVRKKNGKFSEGQAIELFSCQETCLAVNQAYKNLTIYNLLYVCIKTWNYTKYGLHHLLNIFNLYFSYTRFKISWKFLTSLRICRNYTFC